MDWAALLFHMKSLALNFVLRTVFIFTYVSPLSLVSSRQIAGECHKVGHHCFLSHPLQFIIH